MNDFLLNNWAELVLALMAFVKVVINLTPTEKDTAAPQDTRKHTDYTALLLRCRHKTVLLIYLYFAPETLYTTGITTLTAIYQLTQIYNVPFLIIADWNLTPDQLAEAGVLRLLRAEAYPPPGV